MPAKTPRIPPADSHRLPPAAPLPSSLQTLGCRLRPLTYLEWCRHHIGPRFTIYPLDMPPLVFLCDPKDIHAVVTAPLSVLHPGAGAALTAPLFGQRSFLLLDEDDYLSVRNALLPAFRRGIVEASNRDLARLAEHEVASWPTNRPIHIHTYISVMTLKVMMRTVFGETNLLTEELQKRLLQMLDVTASLVLQEPRLRHLPGWRGTWKRFTRHRQAADTIIAMLIAHRRHTRKQHTNAIDMLLDAHWPSGTPMTDRELRDNIVSVLVAGHETTASTLAWAFQIIANHPAIQDRLTAELDAGHDEYLTATINEVIRHRPVFLFAAPRAVAQPIDINGWKYHPPVHLLACTYLMHHDPTLFPDPHQFRPERFLANHTPAPTWLPWGGGRKLCPGRHLATLELHAILRATLATRRLLATTGRLQHPQWRSALLTPHASARIILTRRNHSSTPIRPLRSEQKGTCISTSGSILNVSI